MAKKSTPHKLILFNDDSTVTIQNVLDANADCVETKDSIYYLKDAKTHMDTVNGGLVYVFNADLPARVEAENLKQLRNSTALKRVFEFDRRTGEVDWMKYLPWLVIVLLVLFK